jgi:1-acyl-sn-glycerol-3-phosphate acyltransferase
MFKFLIVKGYGNILFRLFYNTKARGLENIPKTGPVILAANHASYLDPQIVYYFVKRRVYTIALDWLFDIWWLGWAIKLLDAIPTHGAVDGAVAHLNRGDMIVIFPEGGCHCSCNKKGEIQLSRPHKGVAVLALKSGAPVIPIGIKGTLEAWPTKNILPRFFKKIEISFGKPLSFERYEGEDIIPEDILQSALSRVMAGIQAELQ